MKGKQKRLVGFLTDDQEDAYQSIQSITGLKRAELYRRALDFYLIHHKSRLIEVGIILPKAISEKEQSLVEIPLPSGGSKQ